jgi:hypothetical protein
MTKTFTFTAILALTLGTLLVQPADATPQSATPERLTLRPVAVSLVDLEPTGGAAQPAVARDLRSFRVLDAAALGLPTPAEQLPTIEALRAEREEAPAVAVEVEHAEVEALVAADSGGETR